MEFENLQRRSILDNDSGSNLTFGFVEKRRSTESVPGGGGAAAVTTSMARVLAMFLVLVLVDGTYSTEHFEAQQLPASKVAFQKRSTPLLSQRHFTFEAPSSLNYHHHVADTERAALMNNYLRGLLHDYDALSGGALLASEETPSVMSSSGTKRAATALPFSGGIYGKRAAALPYSGGIYGKRAAVPFSGGIYGKRAAALPYSGGIYGKRVPAVPYSGGIYGKRSVGAMSDYESGEATLSRNSISVRAAMPPNGGFYGRRRRR